MGIIRITGKVLEISGKIMQAEAVELWLEDKGKELMQKWVEKKGIEAFSSDKQKAEVVEALREPLHSRAFAKAIDTTFDEFLTAASNICELIWFSSHLSEGSTALLPTAVVQGCAISMIEAQILSWTEFNRLYDSELLKRAFLEEWRAVAVQVIRKSPPTIENAFDLGKGFSVVLIDDTAFWSKEFPLGAFYIYRRANSEISEVDREKIEKDIESLDRKRGRFSDKDLADNLKAFSAIRQEVMKLPLENQGLWQIAAIAAPKMTLGSR